MNRPIISTETRCLIVLAAVAIVLPRNVYSITRYKYSGLEDIDDGIRNRIVGGNEVTIEEFPYQLALEGGKRHMCGGSILTKDWAMTAAHCVYDQPVKWLSFRAGSTMKESGGTIHPVKFYVYHEMYSKDNLDYDLAVVYVKDPFNFKYNTLPITLPIKPAVDREPVTVTGWGYLQQAQLMKPKKLMAVKIFTLDWDLCKKLYPVLTPRMMCAGDARKDICHGDSGGPLVRDNRQQVGIVSWSYACGDNRPSVYTNISSLLPWITSTTGLDDYLIFPEN